MKSYIKDNHVVIEAEEGNFLVLRDGSEYSKAFSLGIYDKAENYDELSMLEWPEEPVIEESDNKEND